jgi:hypothetical protein
MRPKHYPAAFADWPKGPVQSCNRPLSPATSTLLIPNDSESIRVGFFAHSVILNNRTSPHRRHSLIFDDWATVQRNHAIGPRGQCRMALRKAQRYAQ